MKELVAAFGVIASLVFVGAEIGQNTAAVRGATYQAISDLASSGTLEAATSDHLPLLMATVRDEDPGLNDLEPEDRERLRFLYLYTVRRLENIWVQVSEGMIDQNAFDRFMPSAGYLQARAFKDFWQLNRPNLSSDFVSFFEVRYPEVQ